ncbi:MAG: long-chain fatty acid--CoA ligase, partial [Legionellales bacterium]
NVYPSEIEQLLLRHPDILEAAVVGVPDADHGALVKAYLVLNTKSELTKPEIITYCHQDLTAYKVPKIIEFRTSLPKSPVGKILKRLL